MADTAPATGPIRKTVTVPLGPEAAFALFTDGIARWWPLGSHSLAASERLGGGGTVRLEPCPGGRVIETRPDGTEAAWATVTLWAPPARLTLSWYAGRPEDEATVVDVRFTPAGEGTRVDLTHSGFPDAAGAARYDTGWNHVLGTCYVRTGSRLAA